MIALFLTTDVALAGVHVPAHRTLEVVDELPAEEPGEARSVLTAGEARALVQAGYAQPVTADFETLQSVLEAWRP